jgi:stearoyl-CoA desaturase (delta-9 desaturase)
MPPVSSSAALDVRDPILESVSPAAAPTPVTLHVVDAAPASPRSDRQNTPAIWRAMFLSPYFVAHLVPIAIIWTGARPIDFAVCAGLYFARMFGVTGGYHRYFSHRTYKTSRVFQFLLALLAMSSAQRGILWWGAHHRHHHKHSDQPTDTHSPSQSGFWYSHMNWLFDPRNEATDLDAIKDFAKYPELRFLDKYWGLPPVLLAVATFLTLGWSGLVVGFFLSTVFLWHGTFTINSLSHVWGTQRYESGDTSRNNWFFALVTMGEGWHNNHHYYQASTRQGFFWWEIDMTYYILKGLSFVGIVWDLREPPQKVLDGTYRPSHVQRNESPAAVREAA